jgi:hypothetical protein
MNFGHQSYGSPFSVQEFSIQQTQLYQMPNKMSQKNSNSEISFKQKGSIDTSNQNYYSGKPEQSSSSNYSG